MAELYRAGVNSVPDHKGHIKSQVNDRKTLCEKRIFFNRSAKDLPMCGTCIHAAQRL